MAVSWLGYMCYFYEVLVLVTVSVWLYIQNGMKRNKASWYGITLKRSVFQQIHTQKVYKKLATASWNSIHMASEKKLATALTIVATVSLLLSHYTEYS